jgi:hypothetical protein
MKKVASVPVAKKTQDPGECAIPISRNELFCLHDIADGLRLLRDIAQEAPELQLIQAEILINKTSRCAWNFVHEVLDDRWQKLHPDIDIIRRP